MSENEEYLEETREELRERLEERYEQLPEHAKLQIAELREQIAELQEKRSRFLHHLTHSNPSATSKRFEREFKQLQEYIKNNIKQSNFFM